MFKTEAKEKCRLLTLCIHSAYFTKHPEILYVGVEQVFAFPPRNTPRATAAAAAANDVSPDAVDCFPQRWG